MGLLNNGIWQDKWYDTDKHGGRFKRWDSAFRNWHVNKYQPKPKEYVRALLTGRLHRVSNQLHKAEVLPDSNALSQWFLSLGFQYQNC